MAQKDLYAACDHIKTTELTKPNDEPEPSTSATGYDLLPVFEKDLFERHFIKEHSLQRNPMLQCRWREYVRNIESRVFAPFQFPDIKDLHFYNCAIRYYPSVTIHRMDHRMKQKPGPGVDYGGQMPIPQEAMMKRGTAVKRDKKSNIEKKTTATQETEPQTNKSES